MTDLRSLSKGKKTRPTAAHNPVIAVLKRSLSPEDQQLVDELMEAAAENLHLAQHTVGLITELEVILFVLLIEQQKMIYLLTQPGEVFDED